MLPRRVHRFRGCNLPELEFWHVAVWTKNLRFVFRIGFYSAVLEKQKTRGLAHSRVFPVGICVPCLLPCFFWLATRLVSSVAFVCLLVSLSLFGFLEGLGRGMGGEGGCERPCRCSL